MMNTPEASPATTTPDNELEDAEVDEHTFESVAQQSVVLSLPC